MALNRTPEEMDDLKRMIRWSTEPHGDTRLIVARAEIGGQTLMMSYQPTLEELETRPVSSWWCQVDYMQRRFVECAP